jgi:hypothetical protein
MLFIGLVAVYLIEFIDFLNHWGLVRLRCLLEYHKDSTYAYYEAHNQGKHIHKSVILRFLENHGPEEDVRENDRGLVHWDHFELLVVLERQVHEIHLEKEGRPSAWEQHVDEWLTQDRDELSDSYL